MNPSTISSKTAGAKETPRMTTIIGSSLEVIIHELLYLRSLYPRDAFASTRYLGVACHACRHPAVVNYIYDTLVVSIPALCVGVADELILIFYDTDSGSGEKVLERFVISFDVSSVEAAASALDGGREDGGGGSGNGSEKYDDESGTLSREAAIVQTKAQELQRSLRDVLLKIISLEGSNSTLGRRRGQAHFSGTTTFKLCLHCRTSTENKTTSTNLEGDDENTHLTEGEDLLRKCPELSTAMENGKWFRSDINSCQFGEDESLNLDCSNETSASKRKTYGVTRPIKSVNVPSCGFRMQLLMECEAS